MGYNPSYKWINPTYPIYNWGYNPLTKWDEPPSSFTECFTDLCAGHLDVVIILHPPAATVAKLRSSDVAHGRTADFFGELVEVSGTSHGEEGEDGELEFTNLGHR